MQPVTNIDASYPATVAEHYNRSEVLHAPVDTGREALNTWLNELHEELQRIETRISEEIDETTLVDLFNDCIIGPQWQEELLQQAGKQHADLRLIEGLAHTIELSRVSSNEALERREQLLNKLAKLYRDRRESIFPARHGRGLRSNATISYTDGEIDASALLNTAQQTIDDTFEQHKTELIKQYTAVAAKAIGKEIDRVQAWLAIRPSLHTAPEAQWQTQEKGALTRQATATGLPVPVLLSDSPLLDNIAYLDYRSRRTFDVVSYWNLQSINYHHLYEKFNNVELFSLGMVEEMLYSRPVPFRTEEEGEQVLRNMMQKHCGEVPDKYADIFIEVAKSVGTSQEEAWGNTPSLLELFGEVPTEHDRAVYDRLLANGAALVPHQMELPRYKSWARVEPGHVLRLTDEHYTVEYIPHEIHSTTMETVYRHTFTLTQTKEGILNHITSNYLRDAGAILADRLVWRTDRYDSNKTLCYLQMMRGNHAETISLGLQEEGKFEALNHFWEKATAPEGFEELKPGLLVPVTNKARDIAVGWGLDVATLTQLTKQVNRLSALMSETATSCTVECETADAPMFLRIRPGSKVSDAHTVATKISDTLLQQWGMNARFFRNYLIETDAFTHTVEPITKEATVQQVAPLSERGNFSIRSAQPIETLQALRLGNLLDEVPRGWLPPSGRIAPLHEEYLRGTPGPLLPPGYSIIHGLTGTREASDAIDRLHSIVANKGIQSIAERRRLGIRLHTMSPLGDIASGVDSGIPCKIGDDPSYGQWVFFLVKESALQRRDLWFSDRDFGGGRSRFPHYQRYASRIGQESFHSSPSPASREQHMRLCCDKSHNEVWFRNGISLHEIEAIFVHEGLWDSVRSCIPQWHEEGLPSDVSFHSFNNQRNLKGILRTYRLRVQNIPEYIQPSKEDELEGPLLSVADLLPAPTDEISSQLRTVLDELEIDEEQIAASLTPDEHVRRNGRMILSGKSENLGFGGIDVYNELHYWSSGRADKTQSDVAMTFAQMKKKMAAKGGTLSSDGKMSFPSVMPPPPMSIKKKNDDLPF